MNRFPAFSQPSSTTLRHRPARACAMLAISLSLLALAAAAAAGTVALDTEPYSLIDVEQAHQKSYPIALGSAADRYFVAFTETVRPARQTTSTPRLRLARVEADTTTFAVWPGAAADPGSFPASTALAQGADGTLYWFARVNDQNRVSRSSDGGETFELSPAVLPFPVDVATAGAGGEVTALYFDYCATRDDSYSSQALCVATSYDHGATFQTGGTLAVACCEGAISAQGQQVVALYRAGDGTEYGKLVIARSDDGGKAFSAPQTVASGLTAYPLGLAVAEGAAGSGEIHVVWTTNPESAARYTRSLDGGASFEPARILPPQLDNAYWQSPRLQVAGDGALYFWEETWLDGEYYGALHRSTDRGDSFEVVPSTQLTNGVVNQCEALQPIAQGLALVCDLKERSLLEVATLKDQGAQVQPLRFLDATARNDAVFGRPQLAAGGSDVGVVWEDFRDGNPDIYLARSTDGGRSFGPNIRVNTQSSMPSAQRHPAVALDEADDAWVVWEDYRAGANNPDIYLARCPADEDACEGEIRVDDTAAAVFWQAEPEVAIDGRGNVFVVWHDYRNGNPDIFLARSSDGAASFAANRRVDANTGDRTEQKLPDIAIGVDGTLHVAWLHRITGDLAHSDVVYTRSRDNGDTFSAPRKISQAQENWTSTVELRCGPQALAAKNGAIYLSWAQLAGHSITRSLNGGETFEGEGAFANGANGWGIASAVLEPGYEVHALDGSSWPGGTWVYLRDGAYGTDLSLQQMYDPAIDPALVATAGGDVVVAASCSYAYSCLWHGQANTVPASSPLAVLSGPLAIGTAAQPGGRGLDLH
ncbi:MAG: hypothetical protein HYV63_32705 [Candidatus Schekmanbacteria bacterium]|nr:hypothetical protein [Candidatus Schekmanbacteria bacterium]